MLMCLGKVNCLLESTDYSSEFWLFYHIHFFYSFSTEKLL
jgi:hypothetical protein